MGHHIGADSESFLKSSGKRGDIENCFLHAKKKAKSM